MSYDLYLNDPVTKEPLLLDEPHQMKGGTYAVGGTRTCHLNITYNYGLHFTSLGEKGIRTIYGMTGADSIPILQKCADSLSDETDPDYWKPVPGNVKKALLQLISLAKMRPDGIWDGD